MDKNTDYEVIIRPDNRWFYFDWKEFFHYRDLLFLLVRRDFVARYKQTILGPAWFILQPLLTTAVFTVIFKKIINVPTENIPPILFYMQGLLFWGYFSQCLNGSATSLSANSRILSKVYFPRLMMPLSAIVSGLMTMLIQLASFLGFYMYFKFFTSAGDRFTMTWSIFFFPLMILQVSAAGFGAGLWIAALTVKYRDLQHALGFFTQLWFYATPVIYPVSLVSEKWRWILTINPMAEIIEFSRTAFFGAGSVSMLYLISSFLMTLILLLSGVFVFNKAERNFVDTL